MNNDGSINTALWQPLPADGSIPADMKTLAFDMRYDATGAPYTFDQAVYRLQFDVSADADQRLSASLTSPQKDSRDLALDVPIVFSNALIAPTPPRRPIPRQRLPLILRHHRRQILPLPQRPPPR